MPDQAPQKPFSFEDAVGSGAPASGAAPSRQAKPFSFEDAIAFPSSPASPSPPVGASSPDHGWLANEALGVGAAAGETFGDMALGGQEILGHALKAAGFEGAGGWLIDDAQKGSKSLKTQAEPYRRAAPTGAFVGDVLGAAPVMGGVGALGLGRPIAEAALSGGIAGGLQPTSGAGGSNFAAQKAKQAALGTAGGAVGGAVGKTVAGAIAPKLGKDAAALASRGVKLTPGQMVGGMAKRGEDALAGVSVVGSFVGGAQKESIETFNRAVIDDALKPIGQSLPKGAEMGRPAVDYAADKVSDAYNALLPKLTFHSDEKFEIDMSQLKTMAKSMAPEQEKQFSAILDNNLFSRLAPTGTMLGNDLKIVESDLGHMAANYRSSSVASERQLGDALREVQSVVRETLERQNPKDAAQLQAINSAFARLVRVEGAAGNRVTTGGVFTPADLLQAIKRGDKSSRKAAFATGGALGQDFAESAQKVLPPKIPNSGTPERATWISLLGGGAWEGFPKTAAALGVATLPYTTPALAAANLLVQPAGPVRQGTSNAALGLGMLLAPHLGIDAESVSRMLGANN